MLEKETVRAVSVETEKLHGGMLIGLIKPNCLRVSQDIPTGYKEVNNAAASTQYRSTQCRGLFSQVKGDSICRKMTTLATRADYSSIHVTDQDGD